MNTLRPLLPSLAALLLSACADSGTGSSATPPPSAGPITQPVQPASGLGGSHYAHQSYRVTEGGSGDDAWYVFEPMEPQPASAPLAVVMHGYFEFTGYDTMLAFIENTVKKGEVVIYPRWQTGPVTPCAGPYNIEPCVDAALNGIRGGLGYLQGSSERVQPQLAKARYFGFSFGGIVTANFLNRWQQYGLPFPNVIFLDDPHDGGYTGPDEPALDDSLAGIPAATRLVCHSGAHGVFDDVYTGVGSLEATGQPKRDGSCNAIFARLGHVPEQNKALVLTSEDDHGDPALTSDHGVCTGAGTAVDAYDWGFCWRVWDALKHCAYDRRDCESAIGSTPQNRHIGLWSDGTPIFGLKIQTTAPIRAIPVPERAP